MDAELLSKRRAPFANSRETLKMRTANHDSSWPFRQNSDNHEGNRRSRPTQLSKCRKPIAREHSRRGASDQKRQKRPCVDLVFRQPCL